MASVRQGGTRTSKIKDDKPIGADASSLQLREKIRSLVRFLGFYTINMQIPFKVTLQNKA